MPGLLNQSSWAPFLLKSSSVKACANGYSAGVTARLTYMNPDNEAVDGVFVYPLEETELVIGFEAVTGERSITFRVQNRPKSEDCCVDCCRGSVLALGCTNGHLILDEDTDRTTFVICTGMVGPLEVITVTIKTSMELSSRENGAIHFILPSVFIPLGPSAENKCGSGSLCDDSSTSCFGAGGVKEEKSSSSIHPCIPDIFTEPALNPLPYEFTFEMLVKGPCLLAGLESPTHALRADADPFAQSASTIYVTLAEEHQCNKQLEIILHPSEPHIPHILLEEGTMSFAEYERYIKDRRDFIRLSKKESDPDKKVAFVQKRVHKDIFHNPVMMLNFCPDLSGLPTNLQNVTREIIFLIDRSGSMSGDNIEKIKEALTVTLKSLPSATLFNIVGFGSSIKPLFSASKLCSNESLSLASEYFQKMRADMGGTDVYGALSWVFQQPLHRGYPRQLFVLTDAMVSNAGKVLELVRRHASTARCFSFGLGPNACRRLLKGVAKITGGSAEFFGEDERMQPKLIKSLKKAIEPAVSDIRIDWYVPEAVEALLSPSDIPPLYPGNRLVSYCTIFNVAAFRGKKSRRKPPVCRSLSRGSTSSVFQSLEEPMTPTSFEPLLFHPTEDRADLEEALKEISREISLEFSSGNQGTDMESSTDVRKRIYQPSYIQEQYVLTRCSVSGEKLHRHTYGSTSSESTSSREVAANGSSVLNGLEMVSQQGQKSFVNFNAPSKFTRLSQSEAGGSEVSGLTWSEEIRKKQKAFARAAMSSRSFSSPQGDLDMHRLRRALEKVSFDQTQSLRGNREESDPNMHHCQRRGLSRTLTNSRKSQPGSLVFSTSQLDWDTFTDPQYLFSPVPAEDPPDFSDNTQPVLQCRSEIHGLISGKPVSWEVTVNLDYLFNSGPTEKEKRKWEDSWEDILHRLAARSVVRDFENMAEKELEIEHGSSRKFRLKAIQTSKSCNIVSVFTSIGPVDSVTLEPIPSSLEVQNTGLKFTQQRLSRSTSRRPRSYSVGLGRRRDSDDVDDIFMSTEREESPASPVSMTSSSGWERQSIPDGYSSSPTTFSGARSQKGDSFFGSRFSLGKRRAYTSARKTTVLKPHCFSAESDACPENETVNYLMLIQLQLSSGAFLLTEVFSRVVQINLDQLKRASPFPCHRSSLSPPSQCTSPQTPNTKLEMWNKDNQDGSPSSSGRWPNREVRGHSIGEDGARVLKRFTKSYEESHTECFAEISEDCTTAGLYSYGISPDILNSTTQQADSGRGSETDVYENSPASSEAGMSFYEPVTDSDIVQGEEDLEGAYWATVVALTWLEHKCAGFFVEWELIAAKADSWLQAQKLPEGISVASLKAAARQLFLLIRHWDENIKLNMLCYNPNNV
ncbi:von Willebrand factor A domain-containing protein 5B2 [Protopterus annectens]|uniref:von Willebrand factor A domain-containing protein 5B2 n=1 Tax=Protopterus annectens TaxID=7888 RepID=UPI001CFC3BBC|nr:von Willebrand factor A domain-containing protein 5B2 [Protopterus annectens]XP_043926565.1 von Willebrand factor A domain-containing protein 5B2 [Protopterus annectens]